MRIWILFCLLASSLAEKEDEDTKNLNDVGVIYSNVDLGVLPIYPFDAFDIGYDIFLREPHPPLMAAINPKSNHQDSETSEKEEDYETSFPSGEHQTVIVSSSISGSSSKDTIVSTTVSSQNLEQSAAEVSSTDTKQPSASSFNSESVLQSTGESVQVSIKSGATISSSVSFDSEKRRESQTVTETVSASSTLTTTSSESRSISPERESEVKGKVEPTSVFDSKSQTVIKESTINSGPLNSASGDSSSISSKKESEVERASIPNSGSPSASSESTSYSSTSSSSASSSSFSPMDSNSESKVKSEFSKEFASQSESIDNEGQTVVFLSVDMPPPSTEEHTTLPMNSEVISAQTEDTMKISEAAQKKRIHGLDIPSIRNSLKISFTELAQIKKMLFKRKNVIDELNQVISALEVLCDKVCLELPEKYLQPHSFH